VTTESQFFHSFSAKGELSFLRGPFLCRLSLFRKKPIITMGITIGRAALCPAEKSIMTDLLSQNDLNALLGLTAEHGASGPADPAEGTAPAAPAAGLSQGDLDSLLAGLADFTPAAGPKGPAPAQQDCAAPSGETLSQEEIDQLFADFGR
jgi:hypothetical protein